MGDKSARGVKLVGWIEANYVRREGLWNARFRFDPPGAPRISIPHRAETEEEARELAEATQLEQSLKHRRGKLPAEVRARAMSIQEIVEDWRAEKKLNRGASETYPPVVNKWICAPAGRDDREEGEPLGGWTLFELVEHPEVVRGWVEWMEGEGAGEPTLRRARAIASGIAAWGITKHKLDLANPFQLSELLPSENSGTDAFALGIERVEEVAWAMMSPKVGGSLADVALCLAYGEGGLRGQEAYPRRWYQFLTEDGKGGVRPLTRFQVHSALKGTQSRRGERKRAEGELKSADGRRDPLFFEPFAEVMVELWRTRGEPDLEELCWPDEESYDGWVRPRVWRETRFFPALEHTGVPRESRRFGKIKGPHRFRGECASMLGYAGWPLRTAMDFLGHSANDRTGRTMLRHYQRAFEDERHELHGKQPEEQIQLARQGARRLRLVS